MSELFISPILFNYNYLESLKNEANSVLNLKLETEKSQEDFKKSIFFNFNRLLVLKINALGSAVKEALYEDLSDLMVNNKEGETIKLLSDLEILPEAKKEFLEIIRDIKK